MQLSGVSRRQRSRMRGFTLIELLTALAVIGALATFAFSALRTAPFDFEKSWSRLAADLRLTRARALTNGVHYQLIVLANSQYAIQPMAEIGGIWTADPSRQTTTTLPQSVTLVSPIGTSVEFDARGRGVGLAGVLTFSLRGEDPTPVRMVTVWPSGQVIRR